MQSIRNDQYKVLSITSLTEFGERYSYYFLQSLLILFLVYHFKLSHSFSAELVGTVLSMIYISAIVGGFIADRWLGHYRAAFVGACLMTIGSCILSLSITPNMLYIALGFISMSTGLIKVNMSSFIGHYYDTAKLPGSQRDFGFSLFYIGINLGAFVSQFISALLANKYGYNSSFYTCIAVNIFMVGVLIFGFYKLRNYIADTELNARNVTLSLITMGSFIVAVIIILHYPLVANLSIFLTVGLCVVILIRSARATHSVARPLIAATFFILSVLYWSLYFQIFIALELFIKNAVNHNLMGITLNTTQFLSVISLFILLFGYFMGKLWIKLDRIDREAHDIDKFNLAFFILFLMFAVMYLGIYKSAVGHKVSGFVFIISFAMLAVSELSLSAIGLSLITKISPKKFVSLYMGIWLVTLGVGGKIAGYIGKNILITGALSSDKISMENGLEHFMIYSVIGCILCFICRKYLILYTQRSKEQDV